MKSLLFFISIIVLPFTSLAQDTSLTAKIDKYLQYLNAENAFSGEVEIRKFNEVLYQGQHTIKTEGTGLYKVGSVTKVFTAIIIYQLIDEGKLNLETPLSDYFPSIKHASDITIKQMLSHSSGIYSVTNKKDYYITRDQYFSREAIVEAINDARPAFKPNTDCSYSNSNYMLLGFIIEDILKMPYPEVVDLRFSEPLNLNSTFCEAHGEEKRSRESSFKFNGEDWIKDVDSDPSLPGAAGAMVSNTSNLCEMMFALEFGNLVTDSFLNLMKTMRSSPIGHGLFKAPFYNKIGYGHTGRIDEFRTFVMVIPEDSTILSIVSNGMSIKLNDVIIGVMSLYYNKDYSYPTFQHTSITSPATEIFHGTYRAKLFGFIPITKFHITEASANHLFLGMSTDGEKSLLNRQSEDVFHSRDAGGDLVFQYKKNGKVKGLVMEQGKLKLKCRKIK